MLRNSRGVNQLMLLQKCANFSDSCRPISACATNNRIQPEYPVLFLMFSGEFCLRLKPYLVVKIASDKLTEHCCQVCVLAMFCRSDCRLCAGMCGKWLSNQGNSSCQRTTCFGLLTPRQANMGYDKYSLHLIFTFYLNRDTSVLELFPVVVFQ